MNRLIEWIDNLSFKQASIIMFVLLLISGIQ